MFSEPGSQFGWKSSQSLLLRADEVIQ